MQIRQHGWEERLDINQLSCQHLYTWNVYQLYLRCYFQQCRWTFAYWCSPELKDTMKGSNDWC